MKKFILSILYAILLLFTGCSQHIALETLEKRDQYSYKAIDTAEIYFTINKKSQNYEKFKDALERQLEVGEKVSAKNLIDCKKILFVWTQTIASNKHPSVQDELMEYSQCIGGGTPKLYQVMGSFLGVDYVKSAYSFAGSVYVKNNFVEFIQHTSSNLPAGRHDGKLWNNYFSHNAGIIFGDKQDYLFTDYNYRFDIYNPNFNIRHIKRYFDSNFYKLCIRLLDE